MGNCNSDGERISKTTSKQYISTDNTLYVSDDEVLYVERIIKSGYGEDVLDATSDGNGNLTLDYATPVEYYQQNSKTSYGLYELKTGITNANDLHGSREFSDGSRPKSKVKSENTDGSIRSVGIDWDNVNSVSGPTYNIKSLLKAKGFKWNGSTKSWVKPSN